MSNFYATIIRRSSRSVIVSQVHKQAITCQAAPGLSFNQLADSNINNDSSAKLLSMSRRFLSSNAKESVIVSKFDSKQENNDIEGVRTSSCGPPPDEDDDDDYTEEMFVQPHFTIGHQFVEWGGPTRGGRLSEPTRFGDWERKGRCTDF